MNKKLYLIAAICLLSSSLFAQQNAGAAKSMQFILIIRSNASTPLTKAIIDTNIKHWQNYMGGLAGSGKIAGGYRPGNDGEVLTGANNITAGAYKANDMVVSSFLIINVKDMKEAEQIAAQCPVFELKGSVEIRPIQNTAN